MSKIDTSTWKEYKVGELFKCETTKSIPSKNDLVKGAIPYVTRSAVDNGLSGFCGNVDKTNTGDCITIGAEGFVAFYQDGDFVAGNKVYALRNEHITKDVALYICTLLNKKAEEYSFSNARVLDKIKEETILLPPSSAYEPDWEYMENYMKNIENAVSSSLTKMLSAQSKKKKKIDTREWGEFRIGDLFEQERGKEKAPKQNEDGDCPLIQETNTNNGLDRYVIPTKVFKGNAITISINYASNVFYQIDDFCASVNIAIIRNKHLNQYNGRFIASILSSLHKKYDYQNKISKELIDDEKISLPIAPTGEPDWEYMEEYMKEIERKAKQKTLM